MSEEGPDKEPAMQQAPLHFRIDRLRWDLLHPCFQHSVGSTACLDALHRLLRGCLLQRKQKKKKKKLSHPVEPGFLCHCRRASHLTDFRDIIHGVLR